DRRLDALALALAADPRRRGIDALGALAVLHPGHALQVAPRRIRTVLARTVVVRARAHDDRAAVVVARVVPVVGIAVAVVVAVVVARVAVADAAAEAAVVAAVAHAAVRRAVIAGARGLAVVVVAAAAAVAVARATAQQQRDGRNGEIADLHLIAPV